MSVAAFFHQWLNTQQYFYILMVDYWMFYSLGLLQKERLWVVFCKSWIRQVFPFLLGKYLGTDCLDYVLATCVIVSWNLTFLCSSNATGFDDEMEN